MTVLFYLTIGLFGVSFALLAFVLLRSFTEGAGLYSEEYSANAARSFEGIFLFVSPRRIAEAGWACAAAAFFLFSSLLFSSSHPMISMLGVCVGFVAAYFAFQIPRQLFIVLRNRRRRRFNEQLVEALSQISNALKAGFSITQAFESVVSNGENPIAQEFEVFLRQQRVGVSFDEALANLQQRVGSEDLELVCGAILISRRTGGNLTEIFDKISLTIRERMRIERRVMTLTAQGRLQGWIIGAMPILVGTAMAMLRPEVMMPYLHTPAGLASIAAVIILITLGALMIRKIIRIDV